MIRLTLKRDITKETYNESTASVSTSSTVNNTNTMPKLRINLTNFNNSSNTQAQTTTSSNNVTLPLPHYGLEEQFILRLPPSLASILSSELAENEYTSPGDLSIKFISGRTAVVKHPRFVKDAYPAVLMDSPTVMETLKNSTLSVMEINRIEDKEGEEESCSGDASTATTANTSNNESEINVGQYYKVADLNQILMVLDLDTLEGQRIFNRVPQTLQEQLLKSLANHHHVNNQIPADLDNVNASWAQLQDGLTPPMRAAKQKKFANRPLHASNVGDMERIEREVERLLKSDGQAIESKFSLIGPNGEIILGDSDFISAAGVEGVEEDVEMEYEESANEDENDNEYEHDFDVSSASDIEDMNDFAAEIEGNLLTLEPEKTEQAIPEQSAQSIPVASENARLVQDLEAKLAEKLKQADSVSNPLIKARIEDVIKQLEDNLKNLRE